MLVLPLWAAGRRCACLLWCQGSVLVAGGVVVGADHSPGDGLSIGRDVTASAADNAVVVWSVLRGRYRLSSSAGSRPGGRCGWIRGPSRSPVVKNFWISCTGGWRARRAWVWWR